MPWRGHSAVVNHAIEDRRTHGVSPVRIHKPWEGIVMAKDDELRPDVAAAKASLRSTVGSNREIKKLVDHLWEGETVERFVPGTYGKGSGLLTLTDRRLLFTLDGMINTQSEDFPLDKITSIQWKSGLAMGTIVIFTAGNKSEITNVIKQVGKEIVDVVRGRLNEPATPAPVVAEAASATTSIPDQIRELGALRDAGILDEAEFTAKKAELLSRM